jgi:AcrR family transcriptional regulator
MFQCRPVTAPARLAPMDLRAHDGAPIARLAASQRKRRRRIVDAAVRLAEKGGLEAVRLRDVAEASDVALGTLYKYFHGKEDILLFALTEEVEKLEAALAARPPRGRSPLERLTEFFKQATRGLTRKPHFARAVLRSLACGDAETAEKVARFHLRMTRLIVAALRGEPPDLGAEPTAFAGTDRERQVAFILQNVWFSTLVGWASGLHPARAVAEHVRTAAALMRTRAEEG